MTKIVCISDTHCRLSKIKIPDGDLLIHAGDLTFSGNIEEISQESAQLQKIKAKFTHGIVFIPGNHDWLFQRDPELARQLMGDVKVLIDESIEIDGLKIYGSPWQPEFHRWAFNLPRGEALKEVWAKIPDDIDVLVTHGPPHAILDEVPHPRGFHAGCEALALRIVELKNLKLHVFGHLHMNHGSIKLGDTTYVNASSSTEDYKPTNKPITIGINK